WCLSGATPRGQPRAPAVTRSHGRNGTAGGGKGLCLCLYSSGAVLCDSPFFRRSQCMTKAELVEKVAVKIQLTKKQAETVVNILLNCITEALSEGDKVELRGFGSFRIRKRNPHEGSNPKTGDTVQIPAKRVPFFKAGKELRDMVDSQ